MRSVFRASGLAAALLSGVLTAMAQAAPEVEGIDDASIAFDVAPLPVAEALMAFSEQSGLQVGYRPELVQGLQSLGVKAQASPAAALSSLLGGTGLSYRFINQTTVVLESNAAQEAGSGRSRVSAANASEDEDSAGKEEESEQKVLELEATTVTGSRIETDPTKLSRQTIRIGREEILNSGRLDLAEFLRTLPQNINSATPTGLGTSMVRVNGLVESPRHGGAGQGRNIFAANSVNLRGLGDQYTLILIDGRRPAAAGPFGDVTDISDIPINRVDYIEILFDGASSIYGPDAVGGVINIVTIKDYEGTDVTVNHEVTADGGGDRTVFGLGRTFDFGERGTLTTSAHFTRTGAIDTSSRNLDFGVFDEPGVPASLPGSVGSSLRECDEYYPGSTTYCVVQGDRLPLVYVRKDASGAVAEVRPAQHMVPAGWGGYWATEALPSPGDDWEGVAMLQLPEDTSAFTLSDITSSGPGESLFVADQGASLTPKNQSWNAAANYQVDLTERLRLASNVSFSQGERIILTDNRIYPDRRVSWRITDADFTHPFNPFGAPVYYTFFNEHLPPKQQFIDVENVNAAIDLDFQLTENWSTRLDYAFSRSNNTSLTINRFNFNALYEAGVGYYQSCTTYESGIGTGPNGEDLGRQQYGYRCPDGTSIFSGINMRPTRLNVFDPYFDLGTQEAFADFFIMDDRTTITDTDAHTVSWDLNGSFWSLPGGDARASVRGHYRRTDSSTRDNNPVTPTFISGSLFPEDLEHVFDLSTEQAGVGAELSVPIVDDDNAVRFVDRLYYNLSGRWEKLSNTVEPTVSWSHGFNWKVHEAVTVRANHQIAVASPSPILSSDMGSNPLFMSYQYLTDPATGRTDYSFPFRLLPRVYWLRGARKDLEAEEAGGYSVGLIFRPAGRFEGLDIQINYAVNNVRKVIAQHAAGVRLSAEGLADEPWLTRWLTSFPFVAVATDPANAVVEETSFDLTTADFSRYYPYALAPSYFAADGSPRYIVYDNRYRNVGDTDLANIDFSVYYSFSTRFGDFRLTWRHNHLIRDVYTPSPDLCVTAGDEWSCNDFRTESYDRVADIDMTKVKPGYLHYGGYSSFFARPQDIGSVILTWSWAGLSVTMNGNYRSRTSKTQEQRVYDPGRDDGVFNSIDVLRITTVPQLSLGVNIAYALAESQLFDVPKWMEPTVFRLNLGNIWQRDLRREFEVLEKNSTDAVVWEPVEQLNRERPDVFAAGLRGQTYNFSFHFRF